MHKSSPLFWGCTLSFSSLDTGLAPYYDQEDSPQKYAIVQPVFFATAYLTRFLQSIESLSPLFSN